jgi:hypothetical protein
LGGLIDLTKIFSIALSTKTKPPMSDYKVFKVAFVEPILKMTFAAPEGQAKRFAAHQSTLHPPKHAAPDHLSHQSTAVCLLCACF